MRRALTIVGVLFLSSLLLGQTSSNNPSTGLDFAIAPGSIDNGVPQVVTFRLTNRTSHNLWIPEPAIQCSDSSNGYLLLHVKLVGSPSPGPGCVLDHYRSLTILDRVQRWKVLAPGDGIEKTAPIAKLRYSMAQAGTYEIWAEYYPPTINLVDQAILKERGIDFPIETQATTLLTFSTLR
jgi:hypothetical protein